MKSMMYMRKGAKEGSKAEEKAESKSFEANESKLHEKISKRKVGKQKMMGKAMPMDYSKGKAT
jgi:hypothetical protein